MSLNGNTSQHSTPADNYYLYSDTEWHNTYDDLNAYWAGDYFEIDFNQKNSTILNAATLSLILYRKIRNLRLPLAIPLLFLFPIFGIALIVSEIIHESTKQNEYESSKTNYKSMFFHSLLAATVIAFFLNPLVFSIIGGILILSLMIYIGCYKDPWNWIMKPGKSLNDTHVKNLKKFNAFVVGIVLLGAVIFFCNPYVATIIGIALLSYVIVALSRKMAHQIHLFLFKSYIDLSFGNLLLKYKNNQLVGRPGQEKALHIISTMIITILILAAIAGLIYSFPVILPTLIGLLSTSIFFIVLAAAALIAYRSIYGDNIFISSLTGVKVSLIIEENNGADDDNLDDELEKKNHLKNWDEQSDLGDDSIDILSIEDNIEAYFNEETRCEKPTMDDESDNQSDLSDDDDDDRVSDKVNSLFNLKNSYRTILILASIVVTLAVVVALLSNPVSMILLCIAVSALLLVVAGAMYKFNTCNKTIDHNDIRDVLYNKNLFPSFENNNYKSNTSNDKSHATSRSNSSDGHTTNEGTETPPRDGSPILDRPNSQDTDGDNSSDSSIRKNSF